MQLVHGLHALLWVNGLFQLGVHTEDFANPCFQSAVHKIANGLGASNFTAFGFGKRRSMGNAGPQVAQACGCLHQQGNAQHGGIHQVVGVQVRVW